MNLLYVNEPGGFWIRFGAILLDGLIIGVPLTQARKSFAHRNCSEGRLAVAACFFL
ncbi:hypothetical protein ACX1C1_22430 [Paenibacillus sp. strain BS8-2]